MWIERDNLEGRTVVERQVDVPGALPWIAPGETTPEPEYERWTLPIRTMVVPAREAGRFERVRARSARGWWWNSRQTNAPASWFDSGSTVIRTLTSRTGAPACSTPVLRGFEPTDEPSTFARTRSRTTSSMTGS